MAMIIAAMRRRSLRWVARHSELRVRNKDACQSASMLLTADTTLLKN